MPSQKPLDFAHWERRYGRELTDLEKKEIENNLSRFFGVLQEVGANLDLTKVLTPDQIRRVGETHTKKRKMCGQPTHRKINPSAKH